MDIAFKNLIYDYYSKDLSKKVKSAMGMKQEKAKFVNTVPYGYKADPADKHHLIIDVETAPIVRRIFMEVIGGKSCTQIAKELNTEGIPTPAQHKAVSRKAPSKKPQWTHRGLLTMIESVKYTGTMVNHTRESRFIRDKNQRRVPKEEWYIRENAHEAIVTKDEYEQAQEAIQRRRKYVRSSHDQSDRVYFCAHCGGKLEKANGTVFACPSHRYHDGSPCENVRWRKSALEEIVFEALKRQIEIVRVESAAIRKTAKSNALIDRLESVLFVGMSDVVNRMQGNFGTDRDHYMKSLVRPDLLILDDLGAERNTSFGKERVFDVVDKRLLTGKPMIVTTNIQLSVMMQAADLDDRRIFDRILEVCVPIRFDGENFRKGNARANIKKAAEMLNG